MNVIAENHTEITKKIFFEGMRTASGKEYRKTADKAVLALAGLWLVLFVFSVSQSMNIFILVFEFIVVLLMSLWLLFLFPWFKTRRAYKIMEEKNGSNMNRTIKFYEDFMTVESGVGEKEFFYRDILKTAVTSNILVLVYGDKNKTGIIVSLDGFVTGNAETVINQININKPTNNNFNINTEETS